jgi:RHS repeat-associated protein
MTFQSVTYPGQQASLSRTYTYSATQNNGRITQQTDNVSGEQVSYQYDSLNRLVSAVTAGPEWGLSFSYDGFGNRLSQTVTKGSGPTSSLTVDGLTNRISGYGYDANGNTTSTPAQGTIGYDIENRVTSVQGETYGYAPDNKRIYKIRAGATEVFFYGVGGERLGVYTPKTTGGQSYFEFAASWQYFAGRRLQAMDRLGNVPAPGSRYYPYGEESNPPANNADKFATYYRDGTGLDYADQRYYSSQSGRFPTPDPYMASGGPDDPQSWNRYAYAQNDPINFNDPSGLMIGAVEGGYTFSTTVYARPISGDLPLFVLATLLQRGTPPNTGIAMRQSDIWEDMFDVAATALGGYASAFAGRLRGGDISEDCTKDIVTLGITPDDWADKLNSLSLQNGIGSKVPYAEALPIGSAARARALELNLTIGSNFSQGGPTTAVSSANDNRVWIDPRKVNFGDPSGASGFIAHEALHKFSGLIDTTIQGKLGLPVGAASVNISERLARDCFPGPSSILLP